MKHRHAVALALVGWYLLLPPITARHEIDAQAPLSAWKHAASFDSAADCEALRLRAVDDVGTEKGRREYADRQSQIEQRPGYVSLPYAQFAERVRTAVCVATDDPRLKEK